MTIEITEELDPWMRDQKAEIREGEIIVDGVKLPGVFDRGLVVDYKEDPKAEWPIRLTVNFYLDELDITPDLERFVTFTKTLSGPEKEAFFEVMYE
jgi:hypothetical protein